MATAVGGFNDLSAEVASAIATATVIETDEIVDVSAPDQGGHHGGAANGAVATLAVLGGEMMSAFPWEFRILGTEGALMIRPVATGGMQIAQWDITLRELDGAIRKLEIPSSFTLVPDAVSTGAPANVAIMYRELARAIGEGRPDDPSFLAAVTHRELLDAIALAANPVDVSR